MKIKEEDKDLNYWKKNCEEDYLHTPISVLRYITKLEGKVNNVVLDDVSKQSELLKAFIDFYNYRNTGDKTIYNDEIEIFIDSL
jgi:hypothetical protein